MKRGNNISFKRSQVTIFIIIAILILAMVVGYFLVREKIIFNEKQLPPEAESVKVFVEDCLDSTGGEIIYYVGQGGGYFIPSEQSTELGVTYYKTGNANLMPSKEFIEEEIALFTAAQTLVCLDEFKDFPDLRIDTEEIDAETKIEDEKIIIKLNYPLRITKDESANFIEDFEVDYNVRMGLIYNAVARVVEEDVKEEGICLSCILDEAEKLDLYVEMIEETEDTTIFIYRDEKSKINNETFEFVFANQYKLLTEEELEL